MIGLSNIRSHNDVEHFIAGIAFLAGFPILFAMGEITAEYATWWIGRGHRDPIPMLIQGQITNGVFIWFVAALACGLYDVVDIMGGISDYRNGMMGYLPKHKPYAFVVLRARRYMLVVFVVIATFVILYIAPTTKPFTPARYNSLPNIWFGLGALAFARRPLNTPPQHVLLILVRWAHKSIVEGLAALGGRY